MRLKEYNDCLYGATAVIVGPACSLEGQGQGEEIDSFDIVARIGAPLPILNPIDQGTRTDIIFENFWDFRSEYKTQTDKIIDCWQESGVKAVVNVYPKHEGYDRFQEINKGRIAVIHLPESDYSELNGRVSSPTKGFCAINHLINSSLWRLHVIGFTFDQRYGKYYIQNPFYSLSETQLQDIIDNRVYTHHLDEEFKLFANYVKNDPRITCDDALRDLIQKGGVRYVKG